MALTESRKMIDQADAMLLTSFVTRMRLTAEIADYKKENDLPVFDEAREKEKLESVEKVAPFDLKEECLELYKAILEISKKYQEKRISEEGEE